MMLLSPENQKICKGQVISNPSTLIASFGLFLTKDDSQYVIIQWDHLIPLLDVGGLASYLCEATFLRRYSAIYLSNKPILLSI